MPEFKFPDPLHTHGLADFHCHCDYSVDAVGSIDDYCEAALHRGLVEICFTTHYDTNPKSDGIANFIRINGEKKPTAVEHLAPYVDAVRAAHDTYYPQGLFVRLGVEFSWYPGCEEKIIKLKERYDFDYLLTGVHEIDNISFCSAGTFEKCFARMSLEQMVEKYYQLVGDAARSGFFHTVAHLDYYRKYGEAFYGPAVHQAHQPHMATLVEVLRASGTAIEVNTAGRRKGLKTFFPNMELVNAAKRAGVDVQFLGSDAHTPEHVGYEFDEAAHLVPHEVGGCDD